MDWFVNLAVLLVVGYFILGLCQGKIKNNQSVDVLPRYTTQRNKAEIEKESREIIKRELDYDLDFEWLKSNGYTGFINYYLYWTRNEETLTTAAKSDTVKTLIENDLLRDLKLFFIHDACLNLD